MLFALRDHDEKVRRNATWTLGEIKDPKGVPGLLGVLNDPDVVVRIHASKALRRLAKSLSQ